MNPSVKAVVTPFLFFLVNLNFYLQLINFDLDKIIGAGKNLISMNLPLTNGFWYQIAYIQILASLLTLSILEV